MEGSSGEPGADTISAARFVLYAWYQVWQARDGRGVHAAAANITKKDNHRRQRSWRQAGRTTTASLLHASLRHGSAIEKHGLVGSSFSFLLFLGELVSLLTGYAVKSATV